MLQAWLLRGTRYLRKLAPRGDTLTFHFHLRTSLLFSLGSYCLVSGLLTPSGLCSAGFYCNHGASVPNPTDGITGDLCPAGHFCPPGSSHPVPCAPGRSPMGEICSRTLRQEELGPSLGGLLGKDRKEALSEAGSSQHRTSVSVWLVRMPLVIQSLCGPASEWRWQRGMRYRDTAENEGVYHLSPNSGSQVHEHPLGD